MNERINVKIRATEVPLRHIKGLAPNSLKDKNSEKC